jgi:hypothetical protein
MTVIAIRRAETERVARQPRRELNLQGKVAAKAPGRHGNLRR